jgi:hypothetical protein
MSNTHELLHCSVTHELLHCSVTHELLHCSITHELLHCSITHIDFIFLFAVIRRLKYELVFQFRALNDIFDCDYICTVTSW